MDLFLALSSGFYNVFNNLLWIVIASVVIGFIISVVIEYREFRDIRINEIWGRIFAWATGIFVVIALGIGVFSWATYQPQTQNNQSMGVTPSGSGF